MATTPRALVRLVVGITACEPTPDDAPPAPTVPPGRDERRIEPVNFTEVRLTDDSGWK